jgi:hypothetical protein
VSSAADLQQQQEIGRQESNAAQMSDWHVQLLQQQAQLDLLKLRLSQQQKQQRLHNASSGLSSRQQQQQSPLPSGSSSLLTGRNNQSGVVATAGGAYSGSSTVAVSGRTSLAAAAAAGAAAGISAAAASAWQLPDSPLVPAAGGSSPLTLQQRRQQQQAAARGATDAGRWGHTNGISRFDQQQGSLLQTAAADAGIQGSRMSSGRGLDRQQQQQQQQKPLLATGDGRYDADSSWATPDKASRGPALSPAAEKSDWLLDRLDRNYAGSGTQGYQQAAGVSASGSSSGSQAAGGAGSSSSSSSSGGSTPAGASLVALGNDVMGALSLSQFHRERSKQQEARAKQHAQNAQDALDRAAAVRGSRLSNASPQLGLGAAGGRSLSPRLTSFGSSSR